MDSESETESENESKSEINSELVHLEIETHTDDDEVVNSEINDILNNQVCYISFRILSFDFTQEFSDGSSPKKSIPGRSRALNIDLEPSPSPGPSQKFDPEP